MITGKILTASEESIKMTVQGKELMVYYDENMVETSDPCKTCGEGGACCFQIEVTSIINQDYTEIPKNHKVFGKVQDSLRKRELHGEPHCNSHAGEFFSSRDKMRNALIGKHGFYY